MGTCSRTHEAGFRTWFSKGYIQTHFIIWGWNSHLSLEEVFNAAAVMLRAEEMRWVLHPSTLHTRQCVPGIRNLQMKPKFRESRARALLAAHQPPISTMKEPACTIWETRYTARSLLLCALSIWFGYKDVVLQFSPFLRGWDHASACLYCSAGTSADVHSRHAKPLLPLLHSHKRSPTAAGLKYH